MTKLPFLSSCDWIARFYENAQMAAARPRPPVEREMPAAIRAVLADSLPAWQLGKTSEDWNLRLAARRYAAIQDDPFFLSAVEMLIREEQRHGLELGAWLDAAGIPRKKRDFGVCVFRFCRHAVPHYAAWASLVVLAGSVSEIYYAAVRRLTLCPRLKAECTQILEEEAQHLRFHGAHLALVRRRQPWVARWLLDGLELAVYLLFCLFVWLTHGALFRAGGLPVRRFALVAAEKFHASRRLMDPMRYEFGVRESWQGTARRSRRLSEMSALWMR